MFHSGNPTLRDEAFETTRWEDAADARDRPRVMTLTGTVNATAVLLALCAITAVTLWHFITASPSPALLYGSWLGGGLLGLVLAVVISFKPRTAPFLAPVYAAAEGAFLAGFSYFVAATWVPTKTGEPDTGLIAQAVGLTFAIFAGMLVAYWARLIRIGPVFAKVMMTALIGLVLYALGLFLLNGLGGLGLPNLFWSSSPLGIGFSVLCLGLASLFLVLDFQFIEESVQNGAPKHMEWYGAFGLLVTLVWIYVEVLRLLAKLRSGD